MKKINNLSFYITIVFIVLGLIIIVNYFLNYDDDSYLDEIGLSLGILVIFISYFYLKNSILKPLKSLITNLRDIREQGTFSKIQHTEILEFGEVAGTVNRLTESIKNASEFIKNITEGNLTEEYGSSSEEDYQDVLKDNLLSMRGQMHALAQEDSQRNWTAQGLAKFGDLLRVNDSDINKLGEGIISNLVKYTDSNQGGVFVLNDDKGDDSKYLELIACYAYERKKYLQKRIEIGEGMLGQVFLERETIYLKEIPENYISITSGLGNARPNCLLIVPLKVNEEIFGLIELASFQEFPNYKIDFIEKLGENIAATISTVRVNSKTKKLLEDSQQQTEELRAQEEEMRQNHEEMQATQEALERKQVEVEGSQKKSRAIFENSLDAILVSDRAGNINSMNKAAKELFKIQNELIDNHLNEINIQQFIGKFDPSSPASFLNKQRRTKASSLKGEQINVEVYIVKEELDGMDSYLAYIRDITQEKLKEQQIAENLMYMDELKAELKKLQA